MTKKFEEIPMSSQFPGKIYVVTWDNDEDYEDGREILVGAFSTRDKAERWVEEHPTQPRFGRTPFFQISEEMLDEPKDSWYE